MRPDRGAAGHDRFYLVTGTGFATHDFDWISRNIPDGLDAHLVDGTSAHAVLSLFGPRAREVLAGVTADAIDNEAFPFGTWRRLRVAGAPVLALRVTYVGELGWELHVPVEFALTVYDALMEAGRAHGIANAGYRAIESLRLEKGYRAWGADIGPDHSPLMAGLGWAVKLKRNTPVPRPRSAGRAAQHRCRACSPASPRTPRSCCSAVRPSTATGSGVGWLSSGGYGYTLGRSIGYGYVRDPAGVDRRHVLAGRYELEVAGERVPAERVPRPALRPEGFARPQLGLQRYRCCRELLDPRPVAGLDSVLGRHPGAADANHILQCQVGWSLGRIDSRPLGKSGSAAGVPRGS